MINLTLIGIGTGNPKHLTQEAVEALNAVDLILIPNKGKGKDDLAGLRQEICAEVLEMPTPQIVEFPLPVRDPKISDYRERVDHWHDAIAKVWRDSIYAHLPQGGKVGFLVWGDPSLYDSTMRIAERLRRQTDITLKVVPGITSIQALTAAHGVPLNDVGEAVTITTGRQLREQGWPGSADTLVIMLDGECSFLTVDAPDVQIWWTAYAGMENEFSYSGTLAEVGQTIVDARAKARAEHGWIMDIYLLKRQGA